jgi:hypothetical protein
MKFYVLTGLFFSFIIQPCLSQSTAHKSPYKKGVFSIYWGWNLSDFSRSTIQFSGENYDFELKKVKATDRQSPFDPAVYFHPQRMTIPQYNFRIGYFIADRYQLSFGADHMKYVMVSDQKVEINGHINGSGTVYDGNYSNDSIELSADFLLFEHTDGLNYENFELRRFEPLYSIKQFTLAINEGVGVGFLLPRTNTTLLNNDRYDQFHLSGYGINAVVALNMTFFRYFFIQGECRGGFIHMPDIRTTMNTADRASQAFWFSQYNVVFGLNFAIPKKRGKVN